MGTIKKEQRNINGQDTSAIFLHDAIVIAKNLFWNRLGERYIV
jgi:hypothetical protein